MSGTPRSSRYAGRVGGAQPATQSPPRYREPSTRRGDVGRQTSSNNYNSNLALVRGSGRGSVHNSSRTVVPSSGGAVVPSSSRAVVPSLSRTAVPNSNRVVDGHSGSNNDLHNGRQNGSRGRPNIVINIMINGRGLV
ncbi:hypothetical protein SPI_09392 [Niveomyces insectorum RCEF 264]|uniref:Uncharacterized protein n=1 Tax=Niveomyces insectorum RCEF 264 TaxID=1081102 RepID=A0A167LSZ4_9HYPO|nr:hypothetical protein SPI_09392 [Niveomyces insectorum RCEF 264]